MQTGQVHIVDLTCNNENLNYEYGDSKYIGQDSNNEEEKVIDIVVDPNTTTKKQRYKNSIIRKIDETIRAKNSKDMSVFLMKVPKRKTKMETKSDHFQNIFQENASSRNNSTSLTNINGFAGRGVLFLNKKRKFLQNTLFAKKYECKSEQKLEIAKFKKECTTNVSKKDYSLNKTVEINNKPIDESDNSEIITKTNNNTEDLNQGDFCKACVEHVEKQDKTDYEMVILFLSQNNVEKVSSSELYAGLKKTDISKMIVPQKPGQINENIPEVISEEESSQSIKKNETTFFVPNIKQVTEEMKPVISDMFPQQTSKSKTLSDQQSNSTRQDFLQNLEIEEGNQISCHSEHTNTGTVSLPRNVVSQESDIAPTNSTSNSELCCDTKTISEHFDIEVLKPPKISQGTIKDTQNFPMFSKPTSKLLSVLTMTGLNSNKRPLPFDIPPLDFNSAKLSVKNTEPLLIQDVSETLEQSNQLSHLTEENSSQATIPYNSGTSSKLTISNSKHTDSSTSRTESCQLNDVYACFKKSYISVKAVKENMKSNNVKTLAKSNDSEEVRRNNEKTNAIKINEKLMKVTEYTENVNDTEHLNEETSCGPIEIKTISFKDKSTQNINTVKTRQQLLMLLYSQRVKTPQDTLKYHMQNLTCSKQTTNDVYANKYINMTEKKDAKEDNNNTNDHDDSNFCNNDNNYIGGYQRETVNDITNIKNDLSETRLKYKNTLPVINEKTDYNDQISSGSYNIDEDGQKDIALRNYQVDFPKSELVLNKSQFNKFLSDKFKRDYISVRGKREKITSESDNSYLYFKFQRSNKTLVSGSWDLQSESIGYESTTEEKNKDVVVNIFVTKPEQENCNKLENNEKLVKQSSKISVGISEDSNEEDDDDDDYEEDEEQESNLTNIFSEMIEKEFRDDETIQSTDQQTSYETINNQSSKLTTETSQIPESQRALFPRVYSDFTIDSKSIPKTYKYLLSNQN